MDVVPGYEPLAEVFQIAHDQAARGKGLIRHANAKPFLQQPIFSIGRMVGIGYNVGQAMKKGQEAMRLPDDRAQAELLGAMVYLASAYLLIGERMEAEKRAWAEEVANGVPVPCGWNYQGSCTFTTECEQELVYEGPIPDSCPSCGRRVAIVELPSPPMQDARETARAAFTPVQEEVDVSCHWIYQGSCTFMTACGFEVVYETKLPDFCPDCGRNVATVGADRWAVQEKKAAPANPVKGEGTANGIVTPLCSGCSVANCTRPNKDTFQACVWFTPSPVFAEKPSFPFTFPPALKWMGKDEQDYDEKLIEEVDEVVKAKDNRDRMVELFDVIQTSETAIRDLAEKTGLDPAEAAGFMIGKNRIRGYYEPQG